MPARRSLQREIAASLGAPVSLAPHMAALCVGAVSLGSAPGIVSRLLAGSGLAPGARVLDLACGKGAMAVELASRLGCRVTGVDASGPFIEAARALAERRGVAGLCRFTAGDIRTLPVPRRSFDAALMLGLDGLDESAPVLRRFVIPGGLYAADDVARVVGSGRGSRTYGEIPTREEWRAFLVGLGDLPVGERVLTPVEVRRLSGRLYTVLAAAAGELRRVQPRLAPDLAEFLARHRHAARVLTGPIRPVVWAVRVGGISRTLAAFSRKAP